MASSLVNINDPYGFSISYHMDARLRYNLENKIKGSLKRKDRDYVLVIDGTEGGGKSTLAFQIGKFVDPTLNLARICFNGEQFKKAILGAKKNQCVIFDEAITGLGSRDSLSKINRMLVSLMMQMRQKNLFVIVILPTFYLLDSYVAIFRASSLIHVFESKTNRGYFKVYNKSKKKWLYLKNKKTYNYSNVYTKFRGRFYGKFVLGDANVEKAYRKAKENALSTYSRDGKEENVKYLDQRNVLIKIIYDKYLQSSYKIADLLESYGVGLKRAAIQYVLRKKYGKHGDSQKDGG